MSDSAQKAQFCKISGNRQCRKGHSGDDLVEFSPIPIKFWFIMATSRYNCDGESCHYSDVIMRAMASQITGILMVYLTICSGADKRKHQSSASLAFVRISFGDRWIYPHKGPVTRKTFPFHFDEVTMLKWATGAELETVNLTHWGLLTHIYVVKLTIMLRYWLVAW